MRTAATIAQDLTSVGFVALGVSIAFRWYRQRGRAQGMLALALLSLAVVAAFGRFQDPAHPSILLSLVSVTAFMLSAYFVTMFRNEFIPLSARLRSAANALLVLGLVAGFVDVVFLRGAPKTVTTLVAFVLVGAWGILTGEPIVRFWVASHGLTAVQKARMRFLTFGFAILIAILLVSVAGGGALQSPTAIFVTQLFALAAVPVIYVSFAPPALLRRLWRVGEENEVRAAMQDLLIFSPTREAMAERAAFWAMRLVGANAAFIVDPDGRVIATTGIDREQAATLIHPGLHPVPAANRIVKAPLHLTEGQGVLAVVAGPFTPVFGSEEISQLNAYANSVSAGIERVRVTERMASIEKNKTQFLNLASHELRGPVTVIRGYVSMLEGGLLGDLNDRGRKAATVMAAKVSEMNELIEEMIDAARLEEGGLSLRPVDVDLRDIAHEAAEVVAPLVGSNHRLNLDLPDRRVRVHVDPDRTRTIITNLLSNAIKYSPEGGEIVCSVRSRAGMARVAVSDQGLGIARENMATLFTRFGRIITPETEHLKGTGLGLFLSRQLARLQGGEITVASIEGEGSTFTLQLPLVPADAVTEKVEVSAFDGAQDGAGDTPSGRSVDAARARRARPTPGGPGGPARHRPSLQARLAAQGPRDHLPFLGREDPEHGHGRGGVRLRRPHHQPLRGRRPRCARARHRARVAARPAAVLRAGLLARGRDGGGVRHDGRRRNPHRNRGPLHDLSLRLRGRTGRDLRHLVAGRADPVDPQHHDAAPRDLLLDDGARDLRDGHRPR